MIYYMNLGDDPFQLIANHKKTIELRLNDEKRKNIKKGDLIVFNNRQGESIKVEVIDTHNFLTFESLYEDLCLEKCGYKKDDLRNASHHDMLEYYTKEDELKYGVLGIEFIVI